MQPPEEFPFPFSAYPIQKEFMKNLYLCLENGHLGIFESPTGTGKSLSIICGALKWLVDHEEREKNEVIQKIAEIDVKLNETTKKATEDWFSVQSGQLKLNAEKRILQSKLDAIVKNEEKRNKYKDTIRKKEDADKRYKVKSKTTKVRCKKEAVCSGTDETSLKENCDDENLILEDFLTRSEHSDEEEEEEEVEEESFRSSKIYFCSRTHSQLSQFIGELKRTPYAKNISLVSLASRHNYCINKEVRRLKHVNLMNERCLQLQQKRTTDKKEKDLKRAKTSTCCPFLPGNMQLLKAEILTEIQDVEEIARKAQELNTCAYYSSRSSVKDGQIVVMPYNSVLHKSTRLSLGIDLRGSILIIDEAHNLLEAIERMHSVTISGRNVLHCYNQLLQYQNRYQLLFSAKNMLYLNQLSFCLKKFIKLFGGTTKSCPNDKFENGISSRMYKIEDFEAIAEIDTINIFELVDFVKNSKLIHKLQGYTEKYGGDLKIHEVRKKKHGVIAFLDTLQKKDFVPEETVLNQTNLENNEKTEEKHTTNSLMSILSFLECLKNSCADGRIFIFPGPTIGQGTLKFILLNAAAHFSDIVKETRAVILTGGTMEPMSEIKEQLFISAGAKPERIDIFSCNHVIPKDNILTSILTHGPGGVEFEFNFDNRENTKLLNELGCTLLNLCNVVPAGIVVFLPSYSYETMIYRHLEHSGIIKKICAKKCFFREPKLPSQVKQVLEQYTHSIKNPQSPQNGSLLFSIVGGKLSEGLNFSDDLGRCVVVVGMPYPNIKSPELQEKMKYLNENVNPRAGNIFYENSCMKAVNQCIGRAVRHINDYATVILLDKRYVKKTEVLPGWIQRSLEINNTFGAAVSRLAKFFTDKRKKAVSEL